MHQDRCVQLAREAAAWCGERHEYMPANEAEAETWNPHRWVVDAMLLATDEAERERDAFKAGNTELLELLMKLHAGQHESILPRVREILAGAGVVREDNTLNWGALEAQAEADHLAASGERVCHRPRSQSPHAGDGVRPNVISTNTE